MGLLAQTIHPHQLINFHTTVRDSCYQPHSADEGTLAERRGFTGQGQAPTRLRAPGGTEGRAVRFSAGHAPGRGLVTTRRPMVLCARALPKLARPVGSFLSVRCGVAARFLGAETRPGAGRPGLLWGRRHGQPWPLGDSGPRRPASAQQGRRAPRSAAHGARVRDPALPGDSHGTATEPSAKERDAKGKNVQAVARRG